MTATNNESPSTPVGHAAGDILLDVRGLVKRFPIRGSVQVVHACEEVTLTVRRGEILGLIGESGSGKTTLGRSILRLVEVTSGEVHFEGQDITKVDPASMRRLRSDMQIVFQEPLDSLNPQMTIGRQIAEPLRIHTDMSREQRVARVDELLGLVGLGADIRDANPGMLPAGTLQRCSIARAIATSPKLIVLDEPTSALAPEAEAEVIRLLQDLQRKLGLTYIFISHDLSLVQAICDRVAIMYLSQVVELGPRQTIFETPRHPYSRALLASVLEPDPTRTRTRSDRAERLEGEIPSPIDLPENCYLASRCPYVKDRCRTEPQPLQDVGVDHAARCWRMAEGDLTEDDIAAHKASRAAKFKKEEAAP